jgi:hypothetical protein
VLLALDPVPSLSGSVFHRLDFWSLHRLHLFFLPLTLCNGR